MASRIFFKKQKEYMMSLKKRNSDILLVLLAGIFWSFGALIVRNLENGESVPWQYLFLRGFTIFIFLNIFLIFKEGKLFLNNYSKIGLSGCIGGIGIAIAAIGFIWSLTYTTAANTLLMLASMPFITAILAFIFIKEKVSLTTWVSIVIATIGILFMAYNITDFKDLIGILVGLISSLGIAMVTVSLRWKKNTPKFTTTALGGLFCCIFSFIFLFYLNVNLLMDLKNSLLSVLHGILVCTGFILYTLGSKRIPSADLTLLSLTEVIGGIFWVWLPIFGINEVPVLTTIIGGFIIIMSLVYYSFFAQKKIILLGQT